MSSSIRHYIAGHPFNAGVAATLAILIGGASMAAAAKHVMPFINGTVAYVANTSGPVVYGDNLGSGVGVEGVTDTTAAAGAIALQGFGTSTTLASVGVNGAVSGPGSTALIGSANATTGAPSIGLEGFSKTGEGVFAQSLSSTFPALRSLDANAFFDVRLSDTPSGNGLTSMLTTTTGGAAVRGQDTVVASNSNNGVFGSTISGDYGVEGTSTGDALAAVAGFANSAVSGNGIGVEGINSNNGTGVLGSSGGGVGGSFFSSGNSAVLGTTQGNSWPGVWGSGNNFPNTFGLVGAGSAAGLAVECGPDGSGGTGTNMIIGYDSSITAHYTVNCAGVVSTFLRTRHGMAARTYGSENAAPTLEDEGEAQLISGSASVRLDAAFAETISDRSTYLVFITPQGDSRGLFVSHKTLTGFDVHESQGGRSTLAFDYRIVAKAASIDLPHMPLYSSPSTVPGVRPMTPRSFSATMVMSRAMALKAAASLAGVKSRAHQARTMNFYEPRMGADGKIHSVPVRYTQTGVPH